MRLASLQPGDKVQWDSATKKPLPLEPEEASAYDRLQQTIDETSSTTVSATGPLLKDEHGFHLEVREFLPRGKSVCAK